MTKLSDVQKDTFWKDGYLIVENAVDQNLLEALQQEFNGWVDESRNHTEAFGEMIDGRPRFDLEAGHNAQSPGLRRVNSPVEVSKAYYQAMADSGVTDCLADLIGPNVKYHHSKINSKLPHGSTQVKWHQDFPFTPHSNDDIITALLLIDDVTVENGPLEVIPGSHKGDIHGLWHDGVFTGAVADKLAEKCREEAVVCTANAGSVCLMHTRLLHGSAANKSDKPRTLFITVYTAEDAIPCSHNPVPSKYQGLIVRGEETNKIRTIAYDMQLPQMPQTASFFDQQINPE